MTTSVLLNVKHNHVSDVFEKASLIYSYIILSVIVALPIFVLSFIMIFYEKLETKKIKSKFETIYYDLELSTRHKAIFHFYFILRRFFFCITIVFLDKHAPF